MGPAGAGVNWIPAPRSPGEKQGVDRSPASTALKLLAAPSISS